MKNFFETLYEILGDNRRAQENFLRKRGWEPLLERADVWFSPKRPGTFAHDVFHFRAAIEEACREKFRALENIEVHHHMGAEI